MLNFGANMLEVDPRTPLGRDRVAPTATLLECFVILFAATLSATIAMILENSNAFEAHSQL